MTIFKFQQSTKGLIIFSCEWKNIFLFLDRRYFYEIHNSIPQISREFQSRRKPISIQREISSSYLRVPSSYKFWNWVSVFFLCIKAKPFGFRMMYHLITGIQKDETIETYYDLQNNIMLSAKVLVLIRPFFMMSFWLGHSFWYNFD